MRNKVSALIFLITIIPIFILPVIKVDLKLYEALSILLVFLTLIIRRIRVELYPTILFFALVYISTPLSKWFISYIGFGFPGTYYLLPILIFTLLILFFPKIKMSISWWKRDQFDLITVLIIIGFSLITGISLYVWGHYIASDLSSFTDSLPKGSFTWIILSGFAFAIFNSIAEEYLTRGMLCNGLEKIIPHKWLIIVIQSIIFGISHYHGFPGGIIGVIMVFLWSIVLGIIRYRTKGLLGVLIGHFFADFTIFFILYTLK